MIKNFFITGTDTDCGKTYVITKLISYLQKLGKNPIGLKPVASGLSLINGKLINEDIYQLKKANLYSNQEINKWEFSEPIAPHIAAKKQNICLKVFDIAFFCQNFSDFDPVLIEGAGGLLVPLNEKESWLDFLKFTKIPVILIVGMRLGCINHALLTATVLKNNDINLLGWIANCIDPNMLYLEDNILSIQSRLKAPLLTIISYQEGVTDSKKLQNIFS